MFPRNENRNEGTSATTTLYETALLSPSDKSLLSGFLLSQINSWGFGAVEGGKNFHKSNDFLSLSTAAPTSDVNVLECNAAYWLLCRRCQCQLK